VPNILKLFVFDLVILKIKNDIACLKHVGVERV